MKKRLLTILLLFICLLTVACGKKKEEEEGIKTLTCVAELDDQKMESTIVVDTRTGEVSKASIKMSVPKSFYASFNYTNENKIRRKRF